MYAPPPGLASASHNTKKEPRALDDGIFLQLMTTTLWFLFNGPDSLHGDVQRAPYPHKHALVEIDKLIGADGIRVP